MKIAGSFCNFARRIPNKGRTHIFCGSPLSDGCDKTTVEPGNNYSPGVWTCGISLWVECEGEYYSPDLIDEEKIEWGFGPSGRPPVIESRWPAGERMTVLSRLAHLGAEGSEGVDFNEIEISSSGEVHAPLYIVVRDIGPAGGKIDSMAWIDESRELIVNGSLRLFAEKSPENCSIIPPDETFDSPMAVIRYAIDLPEGGTVRLSFKTEHGFRNLEFGESIPLSRPFVGLAVEEGFRRCFKEWEAAAPARVFAPDGRIGAVWDRSIFHILSAMECGLPRIGAVNYPVFWLRDGVIVLRALDLIGRSDLARTGNDYLSELYFGGGFGAESDAPGEGIWALVSHAKITKDIEWLERVFPYIERRVGWIMRMLCADKPLRMLSEGRIPFYMENPGVNILCLPAQNGMIHGRMDWHSPDFFINCWAEGGLRCAAEAAELLQKPDLAAEWLEEAERLSDAICRGQLPGFMSGGGHNGIIAPYPSHALPAHRKELAAQFERWYRKNRLTESGGRRPEPLWTYFEAAQIHNAILLGLRDMAWKCLDGMLGHAGCWDVSAYAEGLPSGNEMLPYENGGDRRGWLDARNALGGNMPHNWTAAEIVNLIRDMFVTEEEDGLVLGLGVPDAWLVPGSAFGVTDMPTEFGPVSYTVTVNGSGNPAVDFCGEAQWRTAFPCAKNGTNKQTKI